MTDALKLALEALEQVNAPKQWPFAVKQDTRRAIEALRAALAAPQPAAPAQVEVFSEHDKGILRDLEAMAADKSSGFWPQILAVGSLRIIKRLAAPQWKPIETAPKGGRTILLGGLNSHNKWRTMRGQWVNQDYIDSYWEEPDAVVPGWYETCVEGDVPNMWFIEPTHWMPLPAAPGITAPTAKD